MVFDLLLRPHCDLHMALNGLPPPTLQVVRRDDVATPGRATLTPIPRGDLEFDFMAPHNDPPRNGAPGHRFDDLPTVDPQGTIIATRPGVYLFQVRRAGEYIVGRLQVHNELVGWWFGNDSITTALDKDLAHAQPSIYAKFSDDRVGGVPIGTDLIGDITGHGYVRLESADRNKVVVTLEGRLRGVAETSTPVDITGSVESRPDLPPRTLPVRVVDYVKHRRDLFPVQVPGLDRVQEMHNMVFLAEGFNEADRGVFDEIVTRAVDEIFNQQRHQPYPMLEGSFNVFKAFTASRQHTVTCGFKVTDTGGVLGNGAPIPYNSLIDNDTGIYTPEELIAIVGLPKRGENRQDLKGVWAAQGLTNFVPGKVNDKLIDAWKQQQSTGILHASDTFFGMHLGRRWADRFSSASNPVVSRPATDTPGEPMRRFVARMYEFYTTGVPTRHLSLDPRRHPPELHSDGSSSPGNAIMTYLKGLDYAFSPFPVIGPVWEPDDKNFKPSRGLVALISFDGLHGGTNLNNNTLTALTVNDGNRAGFEYADPNDKREMRRKPPLPIKPVFQQITDTIAHEFGHSFNLLDEYETFGGADPGSDAGGDFTGDNVASHGAIHFGPGPDDIDPIMIKWFDLPRMRVSARLTAPSQLVTGGIKVTIDRRHMSAWVAARAQSAIVHLRNFKVGPQGQQLPLEFVSSQYLTGLKIIDHSVAAGTITLTGPLLPPAGAAPFGIGSALFVPLLNDQGRLVTVVEQKVLERLNETHRPLNRDTDTTRPNHGEDIPVAILGLNYPCRSARLIGVYEGAVHRAGHNYRPAGTCKMREQRDTDEGGEFCFVCKWLIVNRVDPGYHSVISGRFYPKAKKNG